MGQGYDFVSCGDNFIIAANKNGEIYTCVTEKFNEKNFLFDGEEML